MMQLYFHIISLLGTQMDSVTRDYLLASSLLTISIAPKVMPSLS